MDNLTLSVRSSNDFYTIVLFQLVILATFLASSYLHT